MLKYKDIIWTTGKFLPPFCEYSLAQGSKVIYSRMSNGKTKQMTMSKYSNCGINKKQVCFPLTLGIQKFPARAPQFCCCILRGFHSQGDLVVLAYR